MANHHGLSYQPESFVNREAELALIVDKARHMRDKLPSPLNPPERQRVVKFNAERGMGKSWLLQEAARWLAHEPRIVTHYIDLEKYDSRDPEKALRDQLLPSLSARLGTSSASHSSIADVTNQLILALDDLHETLLVVLVDHVDESEKDFLDALDNRCLSQLATRPNSLLVLAERGKGHTWITLALRHPPARLQRFKADHTHEQLKLQVPDAAGSVDEIQQRSNGIPLANLLYGQEIASSPSNPPPDVIDTLLGKAQSLRRQFEALCVLRAFDELRMQAMFVEYITAPGDPAWDNLACANARKGLVATSLVRWDGDQRGYVIDEALRPILENALRVRDESLWRRLHEAAYRLYAGWADSYPRSRAEWAAEAAYHVNAMKQTTVPLSQSSGLSAEERMR